MEVLGLELNGEAKAIPVKRIAWHLVVNDQFGGQSVVITLCTVTNAALAYRATAGEQRLRVRAGPTGAQQPGDAGSSDRILLATVHGARHRRAAGRHGVDAASGACARRWRTGERVTRQE